jgi:hypothetical protein
MLRNEASIVPATGKHAERFFAIAQNDRKIFININHHANHCADHRNKRAC